MSVNMKMSTLYRKGIIDALTQTRDVEGYSSRSIRSHIEATKLIDAENWSNIDFLQSLREMVKSGDIVYRKSKYKLPPTKSSKKSKITVMNPYLKPPKTKVGLLLKKSATDPTRPSTATVTTFKKLGDEEFKIGCLKGYKFCLAGVLYTSVEETDAMTMYEFYNVIIKLGGTITSNVDKTTDYLVLGSKLEDGRAVNSSSRYIKAKKVNRLWEETGVGFPVQFVSGLDELSGLLRSLSDD